MKLEMEKKETYGFEGTRDPIKFLNDLAKKAKISSANNENQVQQVSSINQPIDDEPDLLVAIQPVNTVQAVSLYDAISSSIKRFIISINTTIVGIMECIK